jgi:hypothetical protein
MAGLGFLGDWLCASRGPTPMPVSQPRHAPAVLRWDRHSQLDQLVQTIAHLVAVRRITFLSPPSVSMALARFAFKLQKRVYNDRPLP